MTRFMLSPEKTKIPGIFPQPLKLRRAARHTGNWGNDKNYIANNMEQYITFSLGNLHFRESCQLMDKRLENSFECNILATNLKRTS